ncbi:MAG: tripartite tricarboxylate transporter substrate binding protein [Burkholderiales bacterium]|nr:tripartite tricarboxylate transporter substrate binding protein [Burkholderiales bacterium]
MKPFSRWSSFTIAVVLAGVFLPLPFAAPARADKFPERPLRWVIPFPPGGSNDLLGRFLGARLTDTVAQQVVIDNRAGANGIIGTELVAKAPADGYTILMISTSYIMNAAVRELPYDVMKSFDPIASIGSAPNSIIVYPGGGINTLGELVARARANPGKINYASTGVGGFNHFGGELFKKLAGIDMVMVPYRGGGPAMIDVMAGQMPVMFSSVTQALPHVRSGKIRMLATGSARRVAAVPDVPTVAEAGFPGYEVHVWWGVTAPAGVPRAAREKLRSAFTNVLRDPATARLLARDAAEVKIMAPADIRKMIANDVEKWTMIAQEAGIRVK